MSSHPGEGIHTAPNSPLNEQCTLPNENFPEAVPDVNDVEQGALPDQSVFEKNEVFKLQDKMFLLASTIQHHSGGETTLTSRMYFQKFMRS